MTRFFQLLALASTCLASNGPQFYSRPDLLPPVLNITVGPTNEANDGYIFTTPASQFPPSGFHGPIQEGPYIFDKQGELVWSGYTYASPGSENFRVQSYKGQDVLTIFSGDHNDPMGHGHGYITLYNDRYEPIHRVVGAGYELADQHEFLIFNETEGIFTLFIPKQHDLTAYGAKSDDQNWVLDNRIQKVNIETNELLWEWSCLDHVDPKGTNITLNSGNAGLGNNFTQAWHYFYMNAADVSPWKNEYLFSARSMCTIFKVDGETGETIWRLGGPNSDFEYGSDVDFCWQHDTRFVKEFQGHKTEGDIEIISFFDNSAHENLTGGPILQTRPYSEGKIVELDRSKGTAKLLQAFRVHGDLSARSQGNLQLLDGDHAFINWGYKGQISEHLPNGETIFQAKLGSGKLGEGTQNYRSFKFHWTGRPSEPPAVAAYNDDNGNTKAYVSWNGDTETKTWKFFDENNAELGSAAKRGFETHLDLGKHVKAVRAKAFDKDGKELVCTSQVASKKYGGKLKFQ